MQPLLRICATYPAKMIVVRSWEKGFAFQGVVICESAVE